MFEFAVHSISHNVNILSGYMCLSFATGGLINRIARVLCILVRPSLLFSSLKLLMLAFSSDFSEHYPAHDYLC